MKTRILIADSSSLTVVGSKSTVPRNRANLFAVTGGLIQTVLAFGLLFLPVFATCLPQGQEWVCQRQSYLQQGGSPLGYGFLLLMIATGIMAIVSTRVENPLACRLRWLCVLFSASCAVVGAWSIGLVFVPGGVLLLLSALLCRQITS